MMLQTITQSGAGMAGAQSINANVYATQPLAKFGTKEQLETTIPKIIDGTWRVCFGVTEPNTGLDTLRLKTTATRKGDKYIITGPSPLLESHLVEGVRADMKDRTEDMDNVRPGGLEDDLACTNNT